MNCRPVGVYVERMLTTNLNAEVFNTWLTNYQALGSEYNTPGTAGYLYSTAPDSLSIEQIYLDIAKKIKSKVKIPVAMKIGPHFSALAHMMKNLAGEGINALVLFNRFYKPDIDIESLAVKAAKITSQPDEISLPLQWISLISGELSCDLSATTGIHGADGLIKVLLAGAKAGQLCSILLMKGIGYIKTILSELSDWMERHEYAAVSDFTGILCQENIINPEAYERTQYIKALVGIS